LGPLDLTLQRFETADGDDAPYTFEGASGFGERFSWRGTINAAPLRSTGEFAVENIAVSNYGTYHEPRLAGELNDGVVSLRGHYTLDLTPGARRVELSNGGVRIERLRVSLPGAATPAVSLPEIVVTGLEARLSPLFVRVGDVSVVGGEVRGTRRADGSIDLAELGPVASSTAPASTPATATPLDFHLGKLSVSDVAFVWRDDATPRPAEVQGRVQLFEVRDFALAGTTLADLVARLAVDPAGEIQLEGKFGMNPLRLVADTTLQAIPLAVASPYVESQADVRLVDGTLSLLGGLEAEWADRAGSPQVTWQGALTVKNLATTDSAGEALAGFEEFAARDLGLSGLSPLAVTIGELELVRPSARVLVAADGQVNLANLSRPATEEADPPAAETPETNNGERPSITITRTRVTGGAFMFEDRSVDPVVRTGVSELTLQLGSFSSTETKPAPLTLDARVLGTGRLEVRGLVHLLNPQATSEFAVKAGEIDLKPVGPYIAKFAGYQLQDGDLGVDLDYHIAQRQLRSTNVVVLDKFTLGAPSGSEEATSLPVPLAVALLKDRAGKIEIDLPIEGSLDDPSFRIGRVAWRMIGNLLTRAATSPFSLLAKLVPGGAEVDLSSVMFAPGATELAATELEKLGLVARALQERPALQVAIAAGSDPAVDGPALQLQRAEQAIRQRIWEARRSAGSSTDAVETVEPTMEEQETALWAWFAETFPEEARAALVASAPAAGSAEVPATAEPPPAAADAGEAEASAERPGPVRRFFRALGFGRTVAPPRPTETSSTTAPALPASPARDATPFEAGRPEPDWAKLEQRLIDSFAIDPAELASLGVARADHVRRQLV
ncbi:MAG TPA: DUF748 domain-containing protein, partial [Candidatus Synoicihabitans sp.]|nr:DUF748 domain-containing protein [Candidatus Synoicihabitans sp.]